MEQRERGVRRLRPEEKTHLAKLNTFIFPEVPKFTYIWLVYTSWLCSDILSCYNESAQKKARSLERAYGKSSTFKPCKAAWCQSPKAGMILVKQNFIRVQLRKFLKFFDRQTLTETALRFLFVVAACKETNFVVPICILVVPFCSSEFLLFITHHQTSSLILLWLVSKSCGVTEEHVLICSA